MSIWIFFVFVYFCNHLELDFIFMFISELVEFSSELFSAQDQCMEVMVPLLQRGSSLLTAEEDKVVVVRWAWASVYQPNLLLGQLGLAFMVLLVRGNFWEEAGHVLAQLLGSLQVDFTSVKLPAIGIFLDLNQVNDS